MIRHGILKELHACNLMGELPLFIKAFLKIRQFQVKVRNVLSDNTGKCIERDPLCISHQWDHLCYST